MYSSLGVWAITGDVECGVALGSIGFGVQGASPGENIPIDEKSGSAFWGASRGKLASGRLSIFCTNASRSSSCFLVRCKLLVGLWVLDTKTSVNI